MMELFLKWQQEFQNNTETGAVTLPCFQVTLKARTHLNDVKVSVAAPPPLVANETFVTYSSLGKWTISCYICTKIIRDYVHWPTD